jgi:TonB family protein
MNDNLYSDAISRFKEGKYEEALAILNTSKDHLSLKEKELINECKRLVIEQYCYLINELIQQEDYQNARTLKNEYKAKFGVSSRIDSIVVPEKSSVTSSQQIEQDDDEEESYGTRFWIIIAGVVVIGLIALFCWKHNRNKGTTNTISQENTTSVIAEPETYEEKSETIIFKLKEEYGDKISVLYKYPELSKYCAFSLTENETEYLLIYDLEQEVVKCFDLRNLPIVNGENVLLFEFNLSMNHDNNKILITGNNGAYSIGYLGYMEYILEINPHNWSIREICSGNEITRKENGYIAYKGEITRWNDDVKNSEYAIVNVYYDFNGNLIPSPLKGESYQFKGDIDNQYAITMQLSICDDKIYGEYYYDKYDSENKLYLYGGISSGRDIVLLEFNNKGEQCSTFKGKFGRDSFSGTFVNYQNKEMPFELYLDGPSSNNEHQATFSMPDRNAEFPGGMVGLGQYITENLQYPADAKTKRISGNVRVSYIIDKDGSIIEAKIIESVDPDLDNEALRLIRSMPKWKPGVRNGKYVKMRTSTVIPFELK